jgi:hypothetical protein
LVLVEEDSLVVPIMPLGSSRFMLHPVLLLAIGQSAAQTTNHNRKVDHACTDLGSCSCDGDEFPRFFFRGKEARTSQDAISILKAPVLMEFVNLNEEQFGAYKKFKEEFVVDEFDTLDDPDAPGDPQVVAAMLLAELRD